MFQLNTPRSWVALVTSVAITILPTALVSAAAPPTLGVRITRIGSPTWKPVDFHLFTAPVGTAASGYAEFGQTIADLLPPPNHVAGSPGVAHPPPYDSELADGVAALGFREGVRFAPAEFSNGQGVFVAWMNVPSPGTTGSSPDFDSGPIIPNALLPIHVAGVSMHEGRVYDAYLADFTVPPLATDGHSHFPVFIADNTDFGFADARPNGDYAYTIAMTDQAGNGWRIEANFAVAR